MILPETLDSLCHITWYRIPENQDFQVFCSVSPMVSSWDTNPEPAKHKTGALHILTFSQLWLTAQVFWMRCCTSRWAVPDVSKDQSACIFRVMQFQEVLHPEDEGTIILWYVRRNYSSTNTLLDIKMISMLYCHEVFTVFQNLVRKT